MTFIGLPRTMQNDRSSHSENTAWNGRMLHAQDGAKKMIRGTNLSLRFDTMPCVDDRFAPLRSTTALALLQGSGSTSAEVRQSIARGDHPQELATLVQNIRSRPYTVTHQDVDELINRYTEDQLFEIIV